MTLRAFRELTPAGRLLVVNQLGINLGYYMVLPFFATFFPSAKFSLAGQSPLEVSSQFECGVSVGSARPAKLWIFENPRSA